jgi:hypothetical protein
MVEKIHLERPVCDAVADDDDVVASTGRVIDHGLQEKSKPLGDIRPALPIWWPCIEFSAAVSQSGPFLELIWKLLSPLCMVVDFGKKAKILLAQEIVLPNVPHPYRRQGF